MNVTTILKISNFEFRDVVRGKGILGYALFYFLMTEALIRFSGGTKAIMSLGNIVLIVVPLVCLLFGTIYLYNARSFVEMLLVQPISRGQMFGGLYLGLSLSLIAGFVLGVSIPFLIHSGQWEDHASVFGMLLICGIMLSLSYTGIAFLIATLQEDKARGLSAAFLVWFFTSVLYDGLVLLFVQGFADYPLEAPILFLTVLNPTDLARISLMMQFDISAMMGYTGAVFEKFFGSALGITLVLTCLSIWVLAPLAAAYRKFLQKDF